MNREPLTRDQILQRLSEQLDDATLVRLFPGQYPADIRRLLAMVPSDKPPAPEPDADSGRTPERPGAGRCRLFTDGASRGNPGQAGAGAVLLNDRGQELATCSVYLGTCTNNVAEYQALLIGLEEARRLGCSHVTIALDSELIVRQIQGRYKVKNEGLLPLFRQVREQLARFETWSIGHVPRAQNARADQLANQGIDRKNG